MSTITCTDLWLSPTDYNKKKVRELLRDYWDFEYEDDSANKPDEDGMIRLYAPEHASYDELQSLCGMGIAFYAREDSSGEAEGGQCTWVAYRKQFVYIPGDIAGFPVVRVKKDGKVDPDDLKTAKLYWKLYAKVVKHSLAKLNKREPLIGLGCECDNTHEQNNTVCRWCWAQGKRKWED